jgi:hypothetical protein
VILDNRQEVAWWQQSTLRMLPADQSLGADNIAGPHIHFWLVIQHKFSFF